MSGRWYRAAFNLSTFSSKCPTVEVFQFAGYEASRLNERPLTSMPRLFLMFMLSRRLTRRTAPPPHEYRGYERARRSEFYSPRAAAQIIREISHNKVHSMFEQSVLGCEGEIHSSGFAPDPSNQPRTSLSPANLHHPASLLSLSLFLFLILLRCASEAAMTMPRVHVENMHAEHNRNFAKCLPTASD